MKTPNHWNLVSLTYRNRLIERNAGLFGASCRMISLSRVNRNEKTICNELCLTSNESSKYLHLIQMKVFFLAALHLDCFARLKLPRASDKTLNEIKLNKAKNWETEKEKSETWMILWTHKRMSWAQRLMKYEKSPIKCLQLSNNFQHMTNKNRLCRE